MGLQTRKPRGRKQAQSDVASDSARLSGPRPGTGDVYRAVRCGGNDFENLAPSGGASFCKTSLARGECF